MDQLADLLRRHAEAVETRKRCDTALAAIRNGTGSPKGLQLCGQNGAGIPVPERLVEGFIRAVRDAADADAKAMETAAAGWAGA